MKEKLKNYFMRVSESEAFVSKMLKFIDAYISERAPESGCTTMTILGMDLILIAKESKANLDRYFFPGDLDVFEMEISIEDKEIKSVTYTDAPRKRAFL